MSVAPSEAYGAEDELKTASPQQFGVTVDRLLQSVPLTRFAKVDHLVEFDHAVSFMDALRALEQHNIGGAPVYIAEGSKKRYLGFIDVADLVGAVIQSGLGSQARSQGLLRAIVGGADETHQVNRALNHSGRDAFLTVARTDTLFTAAHIMAHHNARRLAVVSEREVEEGAAALHVEGIVTLTDVMHAIYTNIRSLGSTIGSAQLGALFSFDKDRLSADESFTSLPDFATVRQAFERMQAHGCDSCAIVGPTGVIMDYIDNWDIRRLVDWVTAGNDIESALDSPVLPFVRRSHQHSTAGLSTVTGTAGVITEPARGVLTATPFDTLASLIALMGVSHGHSGTVTIVDGHRHPIGTVTMLMVVQLLLSPEVRMHDLQGARAFRGNVMSVEDATRMGTVACPGVAVRFRSLDAGEFLATYGTTISEVVGEVGGDQPVIDAIRIMEETHLSCLPVVMRGAAASAAVGGAPVDRPGSSRSKRYAGWIDGGDVAAFLLDRHITARKTSRLGSALISAVTSDSEHSTAACINFSRRNPFWTVPSDWAMDKVLRAFITGSTDRFAVVSEGEDGRVTGVITADAVIRFIHHHIGMLEPVSGLSAWELFKLGTSSAPGFDAQVEQQGDAAVTPVSTRSQPEHGDSAQQESSVGGVKVASKTEQSQSSVSAAGAATKAAASTSAQSGADVARQEGDVDTGSVTSVGDIASVPASTAVGAPTAASSRLMSLPASVTARKALETIVLHNLDGVPIVDADGGGAVIANFSATDVRLLAGVYNQADADAVLSKPVLEFLRERAEGKTASIAGGASLGGSGLSREPLSLMPVVIQQSDTVAMAIQLLAETGVHHLYVVDADRRPIDVLAVTDVIRTIASSYLLD